MLTYQAEVPVSLSLKLQDFTLIFSLLFLLQRNISSPCVRRFIAMCVSSLLCHSFSRSRSVWVEVLSVRAGVDHVSHSRGGGTGGDERELAALRIA